MESTDDYIKKLGEEYKRKIANARFIALDSRRKGDFGIKTLKSVLHAYQEPQHNFSEAYTHRGPDVSNPNTFYAHSQFALGKGWIHEGYSGYQITEKGREILNL